LLHAGDQAELTIADDGQGFDVARPPRQGKGLGLVSITERVRLAGGTVSITAEPGKGTCVRVRIPANGQVRIP
jgi:signal transduction histidine kinase